MTPRPGGATLGAMSRAERLRRASGLDGLRGFAALWVFLVHIWIYTSPSRPPRDDWWDLAIFEFRLTIIFFFVLSGFLLFRDFAKAVVRRDGPADARGYGVRRAARIAPAYYVALTGAVLMLWGWGDEQGFRPISEGELGLFALFSQNYSDGTLLRFNPVLWTLALEVAFYFVLPFLGMLLYRLGGPRRAALALAALVPLGIAWNAAVYYGGWGSVAAYALPSYLPYFAFGMLIALALERDRARQGGGGFRLGPGTTAALMAGGLAIVALDGFWHATTDAPGLDAAMGIFQDLPAGVGFAAVISATAFGAGAAISWTRLRPLVAMGEMSYGFYLWHVPLILFVKRLGLLPENFFAATAVTLPIAIAIAAASWHLMEQPLIDRAARYTRRVRTERAGRAPAEAHAAP